MRELLLIVVLAALGPTAASTLERKKCDSGLKGDFQYEACGSFCKAESAYKHCVFCKCKECTYCAAIKHDSSTSFAPPKKPGSANATKHHSNATTAKKTHPSSSSTKTSSSSTKTSSSSHKGHDEVSKLVAKYASPDPAAGEPAAAAGEADGAVASPAEQATKRTVGLAGAVLGLACVCYLLASWRAGAQQAAAFSAVGGDDAEDAEQSPAPPKTLATQLLLTTAESRTRAMCVGFLCLQYSSYALLRRYATGILKEEWSAPSVLGMGELIKLVLSALMIGRATANSEAPDGSLRARIRFLLRHSAPMAVPALLYLVMNTLGFVALKRVDAGTFAVIQQSKAFFTAAFQRLLLSRKLSTPKWCVLTLLILGVTIISLQAQPNANGCGPLASTAASATLVGASSYAVGVLAVTADSALSGYATVYFERVLKTTPLTVWDRNVQLAFWSMLIYVPWSVYEHPTAPLHGWSAVTVALALLGALGGILVALVIKYADGLAKNLATASSIVLTTMASYVLFSGPMSSAIVLGSLVVIVAGYTYQKVD